MQTTDTMQPSEASSEHAPPAPSAVVAMGTIGQHVEGSVITSVVRYVSAPSSLVLTCGTWLRARTSLVLLARHTYTIVVLTFVYTLTIARG